MLKTRGHHLHDRARQRAGRSCEVVMAKEKVKLLSISGRQAENMQDGGGSTKALNKTAAESSLRIVLEHCHVCQSIDEASVELSRMPQCKPKLTFAQNIAQRQIRQGYPGSWLDTRHQTPPPYIYSQLCDSFFFLSIFQDHNPTW